MSAVAINPITLLLDIWDLLVDLTGFLYNFLFDEITLGSLTFRPIEVLGTLTVITLIIMKLVKDFIPVA